MSTPTERDAIRALRTAYPEPGPTADLDRLTGQAIRRGRSLRLGRRIGAGLLPVGVAVAVGVTAVSGGGSTAGRPPASSRPSALAAPSANEPVTAREFLLAASVRLADQPLRDGPVYWVKTQLFGYPGPPGTSPPATPAQTYTATDDHGTQRAFGVAVGDASNTPISESQDARSPGFVIGIMGGVHWMSKAQVRALPADPAALGAAVDGLAARPLTDQQRAYNHFLLISQLAQAPATPTVRAAAYRLLADSPGIHTAGTVRDPVGRTGTALDVTIEIAPGAPATERMVIAEDGTLFAYYPAFGTDPQRATAYVSSGYRDDLGP